MTANGSYLQTRTLTQKKLQKVGTSRQKTGPIFAPSSPITTFWSSFWTRPPSWPKQRDPWEKARAWRRSKKVTPKLVSWASVPTCVTAWRNTFHWWEQQLLDFKAFYQPKTWISKGMLENLEAQIREHFITTPSKHFIASDLTSYERLLAHTCSIYNRLHSHSKKSMMQYFFCFFCNKICILFRLRW